MEESNGYYVANIKSASDKLSQTWEEEGAPGPANIHKHMRGACLRKYPLSRAFLQQLRLYQIVLYSVMQKRPDPWTF